MEIKFRPHAIDGMAYWHRPPTSSRKKPAEGRPARAQRAPDGPRGRLARAWQVMNLMGFFQIRCGWLPFVQMAADGLQTGDIVPNLLGLIVGHLYFYAFEVAPRLLMPERPPSLAEFLRIGKADGGSAPEGSDGDADADAAAEGGASDADAAPEEDGDAGDAAEGAEEAGDTEGGD